MILKLISLYLVLASIAFGMLMDDDELFANNNQRLVAAALFLWFFVPFVILILFGRALNWLRTYLKTH